MFSAIITSNNARRAYIDVDAAYSDACEISMSGTLTMLQVFDGSVEEETLFYKNGFVVGEHEYGEPWGEWLLDCYKAIVERYEC